MKSTRHIVKAQLPLCNVALDLLRTARSAGETVPAALPHPSRTQILSDDYHAFGRRMQVRTVSADKLDLETAPSIVPQTLLRQTLEADPSMAALLPGAPCKIALGSQEDFPFRLKGGDLLLLPSSLLSNPAAMSKACRWGMTGSLLDPQDWGAFRRAAHELLDACMDRIEGARDHPWQPLPDDVRAGYALDGAPLGDAAALAPILADTVLPYGTGNTHPRFWGWVHGTGLASGILTEMVAATMNANLGGRAHGAVEIERAVIDWARRVMGFPPGSSGVLVSGTSQATVIALACARLRALGGHVREHGQGEARLSSRARGLRQRSI